MNRPARFAACVVAAVLMALPVVAQTAAPAPSRTDQSAPVTDKEQQDQLKKEEKSNKDKAKADKAQRKAIRAQDKANKSSAKAGAVPPATTAPATTPPQ